MKYMFVLITLSLSLFAKDRGPVLYSSCKFCHGHNAEIKYMDKIQNLKEMSAKELEAKLISYKRGELDIYGYGPIMKKQMKNIPEELIPQLASYIEKL